MPSPSTQTDRPVLYADGDRLTVRPFERTDRDGLAGLFERLSPESRYRRYHGPKPALSPRELSYLSDIDHDRHEAIAVVDNTDGALVGVSRYIARPAEPRVADVAIEVADDFQRLGIGTLLGRVLVEQARMNGFERLEATALWNNAAARGLMRRLGFRARASHGPVLELALDLA